MKEEITIIFITSFVGVITAFLTAAFTAFVGYRQWLKQRNLGIRIKIHEDIMSIISELWNYVESKKFTSEKDDYINVSLTKLQLLIMSYYNKSASECIERIARIYFKGDKNITPPGIINWGDIKILINEMKKDLETTK